MGQSKRIRRSPAVWRQLFAQQSSSGLSVPQFCRREGISASLFLRWRSTLKESVKNHRVALRAEPGFGGGCGTLYRSGRSSIGRI
jgi:transposase-like protein